MSAREKHSMLGRPATGDAKRRGVRRATEGKGRGLIHLRAYGEPMMWLTGGGLAACVLIIAGLLLLVLYQGIGTFWPGPVTEFRLANGAVYGGEITRSETYRPDERAFGALPKHAADTARSAIERNGGTAERSLLRIGNYELTNEHFRWIDHFTVTDRSLPEWAVVFERMAWGRFYGTPAEFRVDGSPVATDPAEIWARFEKHHGEVRDRWERRKELEEHDIGAVNRQLEKVRLTLRSVELESGIRSPEYTATAAKLDEVQKRSDAEFREIRGRIAELNAANDRYELGVRTADGRDHTIKLADIVRAYPANRIGTGEKLGIYVSRWIEFLTGAPREANSEGGVFPAIFGTVMMTLIMSIIVTPLGVLAALYLREYAKAGPIVSAVRIAVNNLAGVPSIVFGVFGLGFFCYIIGASIDELLFSAKLPSPTYGTGGLLWASLTLALLTLPIVIVATEEALAAVPSSMREGSYACGASKLQTIQRIVLPRAMPGIMTGMILAIARGAGEVAPLMLVGAVKLAPELPLDGVFPYFHPERSFMHLGFHIYDLGFQSQNSEAAKPMVYTTTLLLITLVAGLNISAVALRTRLKRRFVTSKF